MFDTQVANRIILYINHEVMLIGKLSFWQLLLKIHK